MVGVKVTAEGELRGYRRYPVCHSIAQLVNDLVKAFSSTRCDGPESGEHYTLKPAEK
jgi:hypothetical protein